MELARRRADRLTQSQTRVSNNQPSWYMILIKLQHDIRILTNVMSEVGTLSLMSKKHRKKGAGAAQSSSTPSACCTLYSYAKAVCYRLTRPNTQGLSTPSPVRLQAWRSYDIPFTCDPRPRAHPSVCVSERRPPRSWRQRMLLPGRERPQWRQ